ncbi:DUF4260 domain-containing protein [Hydrogenophaga sp. 5NK40-0174]|uniref:DUF4260 domain-containing protein n=1 Tax=Hydrogenophaga sp. 5NK40-0174 TaxID=3127649 RepID=UPI0031085F70
MSDTSLKTPPSTGAASGGVKLVLRLEGLAILVAALVAYQHAGFAWSTFAWFVLLPDVSFLGYLAGPRIGALSYNLAHSYVGPVLCLAASVWLSAPVLMCAALIWLAHIGVDRLFGYGLKYTRGFGFTHLGRLGKTTL